jgi:signal transduction histidine kinase
MIVNLVLALVAAGGVLVVLAVYFYRESSRELREAAQRVSFVNQVSHELKTPLTNIRLYGELLQQHLPEEEERAARYAEVVVAECRRLSRLIGNILTFARKSRKRLVLRPKPGVVDETITAVIAAFEPALTAKGVRVSFEGGAPGAVSFDADAVEQIVGNLFSNVEKYAAAGGAMHVQSRQNGDRTVISVSDRGPGIPPEAQDAIFAPFRRLSSRLTDGVAGTGIGLSIARDLARLHGGDLRLVPSATGACFEAELRTPEEAP